MAKQEAAQLSVDAKAKLEDQIKRRGELAERRIAQAEAQAAAEVKAAAADLATQVAETVLAARLAAAKTDPMVGAAIDQLANTKLQ
jgi:F-type H+-transporting ATPase subunit b